MAVASPAVPLAPASSGRGWLKWILLAVFVALSGIFAYNMGYLNPSEWSIPYLSGSSASKEAKAKAALRQVEIDIVKAKEELVKQLYTPKAISNLECQMEAIDSAREAIKNLGLLEITRQKLSSKVNGGADISEKEADAEAEAARREALKELADK